MSNSDPRHASRLPAFKAACQRFGLDPDADTSAAEDYELVLEGERQLSRFVAVSRTSGPEPIVYVDPAGDIFKNAKLDAVRYINDDIYAQTPVAIVDLDTLEVFKPEFRDLPWEQSKKSLSLEVPA